MQNENLFVALRAGFPGDLDSIAVETAEGSPRYYTWRDLERASGKLANLLESLELAPGARVAVHTEKSVEAVILYLAVLRAGYVYLPLNMAYQAGELEYFFADAKPSVVVCSDANVQWVSLLAAAAGTPHVFTLNDECSGTLLEQGAERREEHVPAHKRASDVAAILYTSGTTGRSKGAMLSHGNLLSNVQMLKEYWGWRGGDVLIHALPIFHAHGLFVALHCALLSASKMLWFSKFSAGAVIDRLPEATVFMGVPTMYVRLLGESRLDRAVCRGVRIFISGSAPLLVDTFEDFRERTGHTILERYGMTETVMLTSNPYRAEDGERRAGTVGFPLPGVELRVREERGGIGGIEVRGPNVFAGYWRLPSPDHWELGARLRSDFTEDGWFKTGDVGLVDGDGYVVIVGRSKDVIITGGYNVYPAEVEGAINELPGVAESAVVGVPHPDFGEGVVAVVVPRHGASVAPAEVVASLKERIANFKVPKFVFVADDLPRNVMGKVQKARLRDKYANLFRQ